MKIKGKNVLESYLALLGVRYTESFTEQYFNEHPYKFSLYGISKILFDYGVDNGATQIPDKEQNISEIGTPFIAQFGGDFVAVYKIEPEKVSFIWKGVNHVLPMAKFIESWTGIVMLAEASEKSIEPDFKEHKKNETLNLVKKIALISSLCLITFLAYIYRLYYTNLGISLLFVVNIAGIYIGGLLLLKQMYVQSHYADKICSLFKQKDCNNILESKAAKLFETISLSEIGFGYFSTNLLLLLLFPASLPAIALFNILTLPFTLWSVWFQGAKAKQWCALCLIVLALLWAIFFINLLFNYIDITRLFFFGAEKTEVIYFQLFVSACCYLASILGVNLIASKVNNKKETQSLRQYMNSLKADEDVFIALLKNQPYYETSDCDSVIRFGDLNSKLRITVLSNPNCNPCAKMHKHIEALLKKANISIQYILSSFSEKLNLTNKFLIAACLEDKTGFVMQVFNDWFEKGKPIGDAYFKEMGLDMENPEIEVEFRKHEAWKEKTQIKGTPTVLVNGYKLPESYKVEDLRYFTNLDL